MNGSNNRTNQESDDVLSLMRSDVSLPGEEDFMRAMEFHNMSDLTNAKIHYSEKTFNSIKMLVEEISQMKDDAWEKFAGFDNRKVTRVV